MLAPRATPMIVLLLLLPLFSKLCTSSAARRRHSFALATASMLCPSYGNLTLAPSPPVTSRRSLSCSCTMEVHCRCRP